MEVAALTEQEGDPERVTSPRRPLPVHGDGKGLRAARYSGELAHPARTFVRNAHTRACEYAFRGTNLARPLTYLYICVPKTMPSALDEGSTCGLSTSLNSHAGPWRATDDF